MSELVTRQCDVCMALLRDERGVIQFCREGDGLESIEELDAYSEWRPDHDAEWPRELCPKCAKAEERGNLAYREGRCGEQRQLSLVFEERIKSLRDGVIWERARHLHYGLGWATSAAFESDAGDVVDLSEATQALGPAACLFPNHDPELRQDHVRSYLLGDGSVHELHFVTRPIGELTHSVD